LHPRKKPGADPLKNLAWDYARIYNTSIWTVAGQSFTRRRLASRLWRNPVLAPSVISTANIARLS
jgi:hypothetical protein